MAFHKVSASFVGSFIIVYLILDDVCRKKTEFALSQQFCLAPGSACQFKYDPCGRHFPQGLPSEIILYVSFFKENWK